MYYKIENKDCEVYKKLHELRAEEEQIETENEVAVKEKVGLEFETFLGRPGQQNIRRTTQYLGFKFKNPEKVDPKVWQLSKDHDGIFIPNKRTKAGREMAEFLSNGLQSSFYEEVFSILKLDVVGKFTFPYVKVVEDVIIVFLDDECNPKDENLIEITSKEFEELRRMEVAANA